MLIQMKLSSKAILAAAALCMAACTPGPGDDPEPVANASGTGNASAQSDQDGNADAVENPAGNTNNGLANRLRLPDMTKLPTDKELATNKPKDKGGDGVIVRPPSE